MASPMDAQWDGNRIRGRSPELGLGIVVRRPPKSAKSWRMGRPKCGQSCQIVAFVDQRRPIFAQKGPNLAADARTSLQT